MARAEPVHSITGWIQPAVAPYDRYGQFVVLNDPLDQVRAILYDPQGLLTTNLPARLRILATITQPRGPEDEPVFRVAHAEAMSSSSDFGTALGTVSPPWMDIEGGLLPPAMNIIPRLASLTDDDADGDGFFDARDVDFFPGFPDEWMDTDGDGFGDNADLDDDNDGMSDNYEVLCGLDPLVADADGDADGDGMSNGAEARAGTLANDRRSLFALSVEIDGKLHVRWPVLTTRVYSLETADLPSGPWHSVLSGLRPPVDAVYAFTLLLEEQPAAFFRAIANYP